MNPTHLRLAETATRLIKANGRPMFLVRFTESGGQMSLQRTAEHVAVIGVQTKFNAMDDGDIKAHDKRFLIDAKVEITSDMQLRDYEELPEGQIPLGEWQVGIDPYGVSGGTVTNYSIVDTGLVKPGQVSMLYKVHARL